MNVAVIGAGWAGMAAAVGLAQAGIMPTVFETARATGGRARAFSGHGVQGEPLVLDNGQHILIGAYSESLRLMRQVGVDVDSALLREIEHENFQVLHQRIRLTPLRKFWLAWKVQALGRM